MTNRHRIADVKDQLNDCMHHQRSANATYKDLQDLRNLGTPETYLADLMAKATYHEEKAAPYTALLAELQALQRNHQ